MKSMMALELLVLHTTFSVNSPIIPNHRENSKVKSLLILSIDPVHPSKYQINTVGVTMVTGCEGNQKVVVICGVPDMNITAYRSGFVFEGFVLIYLKQCINKSTLFL